MKYLYLFVSILFLPLAAQASLEVESFYLFEGDSHGDFKDHIVVCLSDGSQWKVHPNEIPEASGWEIGTSISLSPRMSSFLYASEHKFLLNNLATGESVKAMLVNYNKEPLTIAHVSTFTMANHIGIGFLISIPIFETYYHLTLSDGTDWIISEVEGPFMEGQEVYMSSPENSGNSQPFIIIRKGREAVWISK